MSQTNWHRFASFWTTASSLDARRNLVSYIRCQYYIWDTERKWLVDTYFLIDFFSRQQLPPTVTTKKSCRVSTYGNTGSHASLSHEEQSTRRTLHKNNICSVYICEVSSQSIEITSSPTCILQSCETHFFDFNMRWRKLLFYHFRYVLHNCSFHYHMSSNFERYRSLSLSVRSSTLAFPSENLLTLFQSQFSSSLEKEMKKENLHISD